MSAQSGLLHTWSHLHKAMKTSLRRFSSYDFEALSKLQHVHLPSFFGQITDRGVFIGSALKMRFLARYDDRLPLVIRANAELLRPAVSLMLDYAMDRHIGVGYTTFAAHLAEEDDQDYVSFNIWHSGVSGSGDQGMRSWFSRNEMEEFAARMGGYFLAKDQHGAETRYALRIPLIPGDPSLVEQTPLAAKAAGRVGAEYGVAALVVDDSAISRALGVYMLSWHNIAAESVESGAAALKKLSAKRYDLIFMDYSLPGLNGIQSAAMLREKALPQVGLIIGMIPGAGFAKKNMKAAFLQAGMQACLDKPVDPRELNQLLAELLPRVYEQRAEASETDADGLGPSRTRGGAGGAAPHMQQDADGLGPSRTRGRAGGAALHPSLSAQEHMTGEQKSLLRELSGIAGLDAEKGLANAGGNVELYAGMLRRFTAELNDYIDPLLLPPGDGAREETVLRLHVLREFFSGIGAEELALEALGLAAAADGLGPSQTWGEMGDSAPHSAQSAGGDHGWLPRIRRYCDAMMRLRAGLAGLNAGKRRDDDAERRAQEGLRTDPPDMVKFKRYVSRLHDACLAHRAAEAREMADGLRRMAVRDDMEDDIAAVCTLVDGLDYREARERCAHLLKTIKMHRFGAAGKN